LRGAVSSWRERGLRGGGGALTRHGRLPMKLYSAFSSGRLLLCITSLSLFTPPKNNLFSRRARSLPPYPLVLLVVGSWGAVADPRRDHVGSTGGARALRGLRRLSEDDFVIRGHPRRRTADTAVGTSGLVYSASAHAGCSPRLTGRSIPRGEFFFFLSTPHPVYRDRRPGRGGRSLSYLFF